MFNSLSSLDALDGARVLDLFAGSGALGIEALSRGAEHVTFVDSDRNARRAIDANLATTGYRERADVVASDAESFLVRAATGTTRYSLALVDPPYRFDDDEWDRVIEALALRSDLELIVIESSREVLVPDHWDAMRQKWYGGTLVSIFTPVKPELPNP